MFDRNITPAAYVKKRNEGIQRNFAFLTCGLVPRLDCGVKRHRAFITSQLGDSACHMQLKSSRSSRLSMKTINAAVRPNGKLAQALASRRENGLHAGTIKRQSSRQMRQRLDAELHREVTGMFNEAAEAAKTRRIYDRWCEELAADMAKQIAACATAPQQADAGAHIARQVLVIRKVTSSPFARKQIQVAVLAA